MSILSHQSTVRFEFGTKAETLIRLARSLRSATVLPLVVLTCREWNDDRATSLRHVTSRPWSSGTLIVRSSFHDEDGRDISNAGRFLSCLDIRGEAALAAAIDQVFASAGRARHDDQVLIQPQESASVASGVVSSHVPESGAPYRVVQWATGTKTDEVTSGRSGVSTWYYLEDGSERTPDPVLAGIPTVVAEIEGLCDGRPFEFEFAIPGAERPVVFQLRPLVGVREEVPREQHRRAVSRCRMRARALGVSAEPSTTPTTVLGVMPDWNPAEMIGVRPRPLSLSLYRELITDRVWAESRVRYGYRDLRGVPLMVDLGGLPYIDTRASFSSLVPASLSDELAQRLTQSYVTSLRDKPWLHDKVEFSIAFSSYHFATTEQIRMLVDANIVTAGEAETLRAALREVTFRLLSPHGRYQYDLRKIQRLARRPIERSDEPRLRDIVALRDQCRRRGTLPFAGLARAAFAATALLRSLVDTETFSAEDADGVVRSIPTPTTTMQDDLGQLSQTQFLERYGHVRPGTYDIRSPRYDETPEHFFDFSATGHGRVERCGFRLDDRKLAALERALARDHWPTSGLELTNFIAESVAAREFGKLQFTRFVSEILLAIRRIGDRHGFSVDDMSYVDFASLTRLTGRFGEDTYRIADAVRQGQERYAVTRALCAPTVIADARQFTSFVAPPGEINFVTQSRVTASTADIAAGDAPGAAIAMIVAADPGYDWIFSRGVVGLVTAYGGLNSHMAIRARELGIPAAIGVGYEQFQRWRSEPVLEIDAAANLVHPGPVGAGTTP